MMRGTGEPKSFSPSKIDLRRVKALSPGSGLLRFAHHPHCDRYGHHLIWLGSHPFCLGCLSMAAGSPIGILMAWCLPWHLLPFTFWVAVHAALVFPTVLQPLIQKKPFKITARLCLGIACGCYFTSGMLMHAYISNAWLWRAGLILVFLTSFALLYKWREARSIDPCDTCPLGHFPTCDWNMPRLLAAQIDDPLWIDIRTRGIVNSSAPTPEQDES